jgi:hypothetical protein
MLRALASPPPHPSLRSILLLPEATNTDAHLNPLRDGGTFPPSSLTEGGIRPLMAFPLAGEGRFPRILSVEYLPLSAHSSLVIAGSRFRGEVATRFDTWLTPTQEKIV